MHKRTVETETKTDVNIRTPVLAGVKEKEAKGPVLSRKVNEKKVACTGKMGLIIFGILYILKRVKE